MPKEQPSNGSSVGSGIIGRAEELHRLESFVRDVSGPAAFVIDGDAGIGKTTLWKTGIALAGSGGRRILTSAPAESEGSLSFSSLSDLFEGLDDVIGELPDPQRNALEVALLRTEPTGPPPDWRAISAASLSVLRAASAERAVLVAVDDLQWLDTASGRVLEFAARRLRQEPVGFLLARRAEPGAPLPFGLGRAFADDRATRVSLPPMSPDELARLVRERLGQRLPPATLRRLHEVSGGNAFFALEIARAELRGEPRVTGQTLPIPRSLREDLVRERLLRLPLLSREALLFAASCRHPTIPLLEAAMGRTSVAPALDKAAAAGLIEPDQDEIVFTHPMFASAIYADVSREHRHDVHRKVAAVLTDPEERARHLALAAVGPDVAAVEALEDGARAADVKGAPATAAELCGLAERLAPEDEVVLRRLRLAAADYNLRAGDHDRALDLLEPLAASTPPGPDRADVLQRLGHARFLLGDERAEATLAGALDEEGLGDAARGSILRGLALTAVSAGELERAEELAERSLELAERDAARDALGPTLATLARVRQLLGRDEQRALLDRAVELADPAGGGTVSDLASRTLAQELALSGRPDEARSILAELLELANGRGDEDSAAELSTDLARLELAAGRWEEAWTTVERAIGLGGSSPIRLAVRAQILGCRGRVDAARADAEAALAGRPRDVAATLIARAALGFVEVSGSNAAGAIDHLAPAWQLLRGSGIGEPAMFPFVADQIEALVELGRYGEAGAIVDWLEERGRALSRPWAVAAALRSRGLVAAATGALADGLGSLEDAVPLHETLEMPFELARTLLALGSVRRRAKQKRPARDVLERSLATFEELGAPLWAERARAEIARIAGRRPEGRLTQAEVRVARLAAAGRTNREIASALFMSVRTVEGHLSNAYRKLELRSRTELALFFDSTD